ncbi:uncharacterized protein METZ01_LOCUS120776, partial [marine metagenome]
MKNQAQKTILLLLVTALMAVAGYAQWTRDQGDRRGGRAGVPDWENDAELPQDKFSFARVQYSGYGR